MEGDGAQHMDGNTLGEETMGLRGQGTPGRHVSSVLTVLGGRAKAALVPPKQHTVTVSSASDLLQACPALLCGSPRGRAKESRLKTQIYMKVPSTGNFCRENPRINNSRNFFFFEVLIVCRLSGRLCVASLLFLLAGSSPVWKGRTVGGAVNCRQSGGQSSDRPGKRFSVIITESSLALLFPFYISSVL